MFGGGSGSQRQAQSPLPGWETLKDDEGSTTSSGDEDDIDQISSARTPRPSGSAISQAGSRPDAGTRLDRGAQRAPETATMSGMQHVWRTVPPSSQRAPTGRSFGAFAQNTARPPSSSLATDVPKPHADFLSRPDKKAAPLSGSSVARKSSGKRPTKVFPIAKSTSVTTSTSVMTQSTRMPSSSQHPSRDSPSNPEAVSSRARAEKDLSDSNGINRENKAAQPNADIADSLSDSEAMFRTPDPPRKKKVLARKSTGGRLQMSTIGKSRFASLSQPGMQRAKPEEEEEPDFPLSISDIYRTPSSFANQEAQVGTSSSVRPAVTGRVPSSTQPGGAGLTGRQKLLTTMFATQPNPKEPPRHRSIPTIELSSDEDRITKSRLGGKDDPVVISDSSDEADSGSPPAVRRNIQKSALPKEILARRKTLPASLKPLDSAKPVKLGRKGKTPLIDLVDSDEDTSGTGVPSDTNPDKTTGGDTVSGSSLLSGTQTDIRGADSHKDASMPLGSGPKGAITSPATSSSTVVMPVDIVLNNDDYDYGDDFGANSDRNPVIDIGNRVGDVRISDSSPAGPVTRAKFNSPPVSSSMIDKTEMQSRDSAIRLARSSAQRLNSFNCNDLPRSPEDRAPSSSIQLAHTVRSPSSDTQMDEAPLSDDADEVDLLLEVKADDSILKTKDKGKAFQPLGDVVAPAVSETARTPPTLSRELQRLELSNTISAEDSGIRGQEMDLQEQNQKLDVGYACPPSNSHGALMPSPVLVDSLQSSTEGVVTKNEADPFISGKSDSITVQQTQSSSVPSKTEKHSSSKRRSPSPWSAHVRQPESNMFGFYQSTKRQFKGTPEKGNKPSNNASVSSIPLADAVSAIAEHTSDSSAPTSLLDRPISERVPSIPPVDNVDKQPSLTSTLKSTDDDVIMRSSKPGTVDSPSGTLAKPQAAKEQHDPDLSPRPSLTHEHLESEHEKLTDARESAILASTSVPSKPGFGSASHLVTAGSGDDRSNQTATPDSAIRERDSDDKTEAMEATRKMMKLNPNLFGSSALRTPSPKSSLTKIAAMASPKRSSNDVLGQIRGMFKEKSKLNSKPISKPPQEHIALSPTTERTKLEEEQRSQVNVDPNQSTKEITNLEQAVLPSFSQQETLVLPADPGSQNRSQALEPESTVPVTASSSPEFGETPPARSDVQDIINVSTLKATASLSKTNASGVLQADTSTHKDSEPLHTPVQRSRKRLRSASPKYPRTDASQGKSDGEVRGLSKRPRTSKDISGRSQSHSSTSTIDPMDLLDVRTDDERDSLLEQPRSPVSEITVGVDEVITIPKPTTHSPPLEIDRYFVERDYGTVYRRAVDIPKELVNEVNDIPVWSRDPDLLRQVFESAIMTNTTHDEPNAPYIQLINNIDDDPTPPFEFYYTNHLWHGEGVPPPDYQNLQGCGCIGKCDPRSKTCACLKRQRDAFSKTDFMLDGFIYDEKGRLRMHNIPIFECNDACGCTDDCRNRVVQHGRKCHVNILKTANKGWGVFAGKRIPKGTFIGIYSGELLLEEEAEMRGLVYDKLGRTYLFDIDFWHIPKGEGETCKYCVDAFHAGNFTRYLNHSCEPNCRINACHINDADVEKALLTIFAEKDISAGEELCFSYLGDDNNNDEEDTTPILSSPGKKAAPSRDKVCGRCECGAPSCTGVLFSNAVGLRVED